MVVAGFRDFRSGLRKVLDPLSHLICTEVRCLCSWRFGMIKEDAVDRLREFLDNSECSPGIIVPGIFNVDRKDFLYIP